jgi:hypothetical protein
VKDVGPRPLTPVRVSSAASSTGPAKIAAKQHAELVNTLDLIEVLPPGLSETILEEKKTEDVGADLSAVELSTLVVSFPYPACPSTRHFGQKNLPVDIPTVFAGPGAMNRRFGATATS